MIAKSRLDALTDGVFAVAMTLLAIDLRFPENFNPSDGRELAVAIGNLLLSGPFLAYFFSFFVIGMRWRTISRLGGTRAHVGDHFVRWSFVHLFLITCMPFSTMVVGRYVDLAPAAWLYAANHFLAAAAAWRLVRASDAEEDTGQADEANISLPTIMAVATLSAGVSLFSPRLAMWTYGLTLLAPVLTRWRAR